MRFGDEAPGLRLLKCRTEENMKNDRVYKIAAAVGTFAADLLFPRRCPVCGNIVDGGRAAGGICPGCVRKLSPVREPVCKKCGKGLFSDRQEYCPDCIRRPKSFEAGRALLHYNEAARNSVTAVKYKNRREYLDFYAEAMARRYRDTVRRWQPQVLVPVPVHPSRRRQRGFNQAEELAVRLGERLGIPVESRLLVRTRKTAAQYGLGASERLKNLQQAFAVRPGTRLPESVLLIDDIYTTGSTAEACTRVLKSAGVRRVYVLTICIGGD